MNKPTANDVARAFGVSEGDTCNRGGCAGVIKRRKEDSCSCHIAPPCSQCTKPAEYCTVCGWDAEDDETNAATPDATRKTPAWWQRTRTEADLDSTKIDWIPKLHTHFTMKKVGVYPEGTTREEVLDSIGRGTFGGRFESFGGGRFIYIAYTD